MFKDDLIDILTGLVKKYAIPVDLLRLEITESAFSKSAKQIIEVVQRLLDEGFTVEIDDFGSGYSSLNTLKDVPAQILKLDMRFLEDNENSQRGGNILESIVRMAKWLGMSVIAEGVETIEQANYLKSIGSSYVQGYLYARPMPQADYEALAKGVSKEERLLKLETIENLDNNNFWDPKSMDTLIFNSYIGGACIFEYHDEKIELLRANDKYAQMIGIAGMTIEDALKLDLTKHIDEESAKRVAINLEASAKNKDEVTDEYLFLDLPGCSAKVYLRSTMRVIASVGDRYLVYCTNENVTALRVAQEKEREAEAKRKTASEQLQAILNNVNGGVSAAKLTNGVIGYIFVNDEYYSMFGYTKEQFENELPNGLVDLINPEDFPTVNAAAEENKRTNKPTRITYRVRRRDGDEIWVRSNSSVCYIDGEDDAIHIAVTVDITAEREAADNLRRANEQTQAIMDDIDSGITAAVMEGGKTRFLLSNEMYYRIIGYTRAQFAKEITDPYSPIHPADRQLMMKIADEVKRTRKPKQTEMRVIRRDGTVRWLLAQLSSTKFTGVAQDVQLCVYTDITEKKEMEQQLRETDMKLKLLTDNIPGGIAGYTYRGGRYYINYFNDGFCKLLGYTREEYEKRSTNDPTGRVFKEDVPELLKKLDSMVESGEPIECVYRVHVKGSGFKWISHRGVLVERKGDSAILNAVLFDVTKQQEAAEKLRINAEAYRLATQHSGNIIGHFDIKNRTLTLDEDVAARRGVRKKVVDVPYEQIRKGKLAPESEKAYTDFFLEIINGGTSGKTLYHYKMPDGWRWLEAHYSTIFKDNGEPTFAVISYFDVTERIENKALQ